MTAANEAKGPAPTPKQVDALVLEFVAAQAYLQSAGAIEKQPGETADAIKARLAEFLDAAAEQKSKAAETFDEVKARLVTMIDGYGFAHTTSTTRIQGLLTKASSTVAKKVTIDDAAVENVRIFTEKEGLVEVAGALFVKHVSYTLVASPADIVAPLKLKAAVRKKLDMLLALVWRVTTNAPSIKIETMDTAPSKAA